MASPRADANHTGNLLDDSNSDEKLAQFMACTNAPENEAKHWLEANAYSVESAINMYMEGGSGEGTSGYLGASDTGPTRNGNPYFGSSAGGGGASDTDDDISAGAHGARASSSGSDPRDPDYVRPADPYKRQRLVDDVHSHTYGGVSTTRPWTAATGSNPFRGVSQESRDEAPRVFSARSSAKPSDTDRHKKLASIFSTPDDILFKGGFQDARQTAKQNKKWLLVNIEAQEVFDSHKLNRDLWKDEMVVNVISCSCVFWQEWTTDEEAKTYCRRYNITEFPHIALIDPRTGMMILEIKGFLEPTAFIEKVTDTTDRNSLEDGAAPRLPPPPRPPQLPPNTSGSEDQFLAAAIAASLEGNAKGSTGADGDGASASMDDGDGGSSSNGHGGGPSSPVRGFVPHDRFSPSPERRTVTESLKLPASSSSSLPPSRLSSSASLSRISTAVAEGSTPASVLASAAASPTTSEATTSEAPQGVQATSDIPDSPNRHTSKRLKGEGSAAHPASVDEDEDSDVAVVGVPVAGDNGGSIKSKGKRKSSEIGSSSDSACGSDGAGSASGKDGATPARASGGYTPGEVVDVSGDDETKESGDANGVSSEVEAVVASQIARGPSPDRVKQVETQGAASSEVKVEENQETLESAPEESEVDRTSVRFQFPTGRRAVRRFRKSSNVRQLYLFVEAELEGAVSKAFDVRTVRPPSSVRDNINSSIQEAGLCNSTVVVVWLD